MKLKGDVTSAHANSMCQLHYVYLREYMVQIMYAPLEVSAIGLRDLCGTKHSISCHVQVHTNIVDNVLIRFSSGRIREFDILPPVVCKYTQRSQMT